MASNRLRHFVTNLAVKHLLKAVTADEILSISAKGWFVGTRKLTTEEIIDLREEAASFVKSSLYRLLKREIKYRATLQRYDMAKTSDDMIFGKAMLYDLDLIDIFIKNIGSL